MKHKNKDMRITYFLVVVMISVLIFALYRAERVKASLYNPYIGSYNVTPKPEVNKPTVEEVKAYIKTVFGSEWRVAWAISQAECSPSRKEWPYCVCSWEKERSIGLFQINIAKNNGLGQKVHWDKIPGETLGEKELWLADYKNNILMAYRIYKDSGWYAWSAYLNSSYKSHLK